MRVLLTLFFASILFPLASQSLALEDSLLQQQFRDQEITLDRYRQLAGDLRDAAEEAGGYPTMPVDSAGRYRLTTKIATGLSFLKLNLLIQRWLALGGFSGAERYALANEDGMVRYVETPYQFNGQHRELLEPLRGLADLSTIGCVMEVVYGNGEVTITWSDPLLVERYENYTTSLNDGVAAASRARPVDMAGLLPLTDGDKKRYAYKLKRARLIHDCVSGLSGSLTAFLREAAPEVSGQ